MKNYYRILNIREKATDDELKRSFRMLAKRFHPDVCKEENAAERFADVNEAYGVLSDPVKRAAYDRLLAKEYEARLSPEKIIAQRYPSRASVKKPDTSRQEDDYLRRQAEYAAKREAARREAETRATVLRDAVHGGVDPSVIMAQQQVATIRAQAQEQARKFSAQLAAAEKRAHEQGVEEGKRAVKADLNAVNGELKTVKSENFKLQTKLDGVLRDRQDLENELFNRDREFSEQKLRASELEKQIETLKSHTVERTELTAVNTELKNANSELRTARTENANLKRTIDAMEKARAELEKRLANAAELRAKAEKLQKQVNKLESEQSVAKNANIKDKVLAEELRLKIAKTQRQLESLERDNNVLTENLRRAKEAYERERARAEKERDRAEKAAKAANGASLKNGVPKELHAKIAKTQERLETLERDNGELVESLRRAKEEYEKERIRTEKEHERAEKVARAAKTLMEENSASLQSCAQQELAKTQAQLETLERDNDALAENLRRAKEAYEKERLRAEKEHERAEEERKRAEKANKMAEVLGNERRKLIEMAETKYDESVNEINARLEDEQKKKSELKESLQKLNFELEKERKRVYLDRESKYDSEVEINRLTFSAEAGDANAQNALGELYLYGKNENYKLALRWLKEAAKKKHADAMYNLGICYIIGAGVPKNTNTGMGFIRTAARLGSERARQYYYSVSELD